MPSSAGRTSCPASNTTAPRLQVLAGEAPVLARPCRPRRRRRARRRRPRARAPASRRCRRPRGITRAGEDAHALARRRRAPSNGLPANDSPTRAQRRLAVGGRGRRSAPRSRPSPSCRGRARRAARSTSAASTRPSAARMWTRSVAVTGVEERADQRARRRRPASSSDRSRRRRRARAGSSAGTCGCGRGVRAGSVADQRRACGRVVSSSAVLMLRNASASSSNAHLDDAQRRVPRVDLAPAAGEERVEVRQHVAAHERRTPDAAGRTVLRDGELRAARVQRRARAARPDRAAGTANRRAR